MGPAGDAAGNGAPPPSDDRMVQDTENPDYNRSANGGAVAAPASATASEKGSGRPEKQIKPNKVYIGGLPEHTRREDLQSCFGKIGNIVNIELKIGYGFVEFDNKEAAEESVAKYNEGYFMGNKIRVEVSHGGGRTQKYASDPGACFKCGQLGHWARECPNHSLSAGGRRDGALIDRIQAPRDYLPPPPPRDYPYRDDYSRYPPPPPRDPRYYDYPPLPPPGREYRRPLSPPPRDYRDYPGAPPPRSSRDVDEYKSRGPPPPPSRYESRPGYYDDLAPPPGYPPRPVGGPPPPPRDYYDRYDRRAPPPPPPAAAGGDRYGSYPPSTTTRPRTPPGAPPPPRAREARDDYDRPPPARDYPPPAPEPRGRPVSPPPARYAEYARAGSTDPAPRYRRRSQSPPPRGSSSAAGYDSGYTSGAPRGFGGNSYAGGGGPPSPRGGGSRDYPRSRDPEPSGGYSRRP
ncbi:hypothetical protein OE88DRAFT_1709832 [Heliocybe sulcata]|uniref:RNA-binding domain-containing protein n=1 Tax=Heliocybe sulcata TaxID=5364 RepID=A0A5C3NIW1_9AGAM|nr:hypothetical protein OE88DRAFT_1709832 [Heliocybe sulcata]